MAQDDLLRLREDIEQYRTLDRDDPEEDRTRKRSRETEGEARKRRGERRYLRRSFEP